LIAGQFPSYVLFFINQDYDQRRDKNNLHTDKPLKYSHPTVSPTVLISFSNRQFITRTGIIHDITNP
ncbi:hypothetical protein, partial [Escherichia coli]|uniref:hypothetical protein n=1 Tax=Escherichia coli TaxID=562 RepID=UPI00301C0D01